MTEKDKCVILGLDPGIQTQLDLLDSRFHGNDTEKSGNDTKKKKVL